MAVGSHKWGRRGRMEGMVPSCGHRGQLGDWGELCRVIGRKRARALCKGPAQVTPPLLGRWVKILHCGFMVCVDVFRGTTSSSSSFPAPIPGICGAPPLVLDPKWLDAKKEYSVDLCCVPGTWNFLLDPMQRVRSHCFTNEETETQWRHRSYLRSL